MQRWALVAVLILIACSNGIAASGDSVYSPRPPRRPSDCTLGVSTHSLSTDVKGLRTAIETRYANDWKCTDKIDASILSPDPHWGHQNACSNFIKSKGKLGSWGQFAYQHITKERYPNLFRVPKDVAKICPNSKSWKEPQFKKFYIWTLAQTSFFESGCRAKPREHRGPYGTLQGQFQMHKGHEANYSTFCQNGDAASPLPSIRCMIGMLDDDVGDGQKLFQRAGVAHFATLRTHDAAGLRVCEGLRRFPGCGQGASCASVIGGGRHRHRKAHR